MANPVAAFRLVKSGVSWLERAVVKHGLRLPKDLQASIDDPAQMERIIRYIQAGAPVLEIAAPVLLPFEEPQSHREARRILGDRNFHGVEAAQRCFRPYTEAELSKRRALRLLDEKRNVLFSEDETLKIVEECKDTHFLSATHALDLIGIHAGHTDRFDNDPDAPWFGERHERTWATRKIAAPWMLVGRKEVPDSWNKSMDDQKGHLALTLPKDRLILPGEYSYVALLRQAETGEQLCKGYWIRFPVQAAGRGWVSAYWDGKRLGVSHWDADAYDRVASCSVRAS